jgi:hypothetical protein
MALPVLCFTLMLQGRSREVDSSQPNRRAESCLSAISPFSIVGEPATWIVDKLPSMGQASGVLTIVRLNGHKGIVDFHDFFVESYWNPP